ncbi:MAG: DUF3142 domain-containing protein [Candidatus Hydrogenedentes bacterium]|nr:DUF3142 domain-containing protein [Candidatus Hydrogenedentota bacterium]
MRKKIVSFALVAALAAACCVYFAIRSRPPAPSFEPFTHTIYVWQRSWTDDVVDGVHAAAAGCNGFSVLAAETSFVDGDLDAIRVDPDWPALAAAGLPVTLVLRADVSLSELLAQDDGPRRAAEFLAVVARAASAGATDAGADVAGVQLDYDCPTARLAAYRALLEAFRAAVPGLDVSITALPSWVRTRRFRQLVGGLSYFVLQVHSLEKPGSVDEPVELCPTDRIPTYLRRAARARTPYYLALPTYGYEMAFTADGAFLGLGAEGPRAEWPSGTVCKVVMAEPAAIANTVRTVSADPPPWLAGFAWFRLPVATDQLNWAWPTLEAVMAGREPVVAFTADVRTPSPDLFEIWVANSGEYNVPGDIGLKVSWPGRSVAARDTVNGFREERGDGPDEARLIGAAPPVGQPAVLAAWYRLAPDDDSEAAPLQAGNVEVL